MVRNTPQGHGTGDGGDSETVILHRHTLRNTCIAATVVTVLLTAGSLLSARYYTANQDLQRQVAHLSTRLHEPPPHTAAALQKQIDALKQQLTTARQELAARSQRRGEQIRQYEGQISELKKRQQELLAVKTARLDERNRALNAVIKRSAGDVKVMNDPKHSGGLFIASQANKAGREKLGRELDLYLDELENLPLGKPIATEISSEFGHRTDPFNRKKAFHSGLDFRGNTGDPVQATGSGRVKESGYASDYGEFIRVSHGNGFETLFAHLSKRLVKRGDRVVQGQKVGLVGSTGRSTGSHLHYEIRHKGKPVDPMRYVRVADLPKVGKKTAR
jgi:murein DD-endopeptidase MepM/ murein hydrolase activator NlpD